MGTERDKGTTMIPELQFARLSHGLLSYREAGKGRPVVLLHGMNGNSKSWAYQFAGLSDRYRVIAWDAPGFGSSEVCEASPEGYVRAGLEFLRAVGAEEAVLVGHSMGGVVAARVAAEPGSPVAKLVLSCTHWGYARADAEELMPRYAKRIEEMQSLDRETYARIRASKMLPPGTETSNPEVFALVAEVAGEGRAEGLAAAGRMIQSADNRPIFSRLRLPVMILYGEKDPVISKEKTDELIAALPDAQVHMIPGAGHAPYAEHSALYNALLDAFARA